MCSICIYCNNVPAFPGSGECGHIVAIYTYTAHMYPNILHIYMYIHTYMQDPGNAGTLLQYIHILQICILCTYVDICKACAAWIHVCNVYEHTLDHIYTYVYTCVCRYLYVDDRYGVATISRLLEIIGLFCGISSLL